jgi:ABC-type phosphate transport system ATPase subunit
MSAPQHLADGEAILAIRDLNFYYGDFRGLTDVSLDIAKTR